MHRGKWVVATTINPPTQALTTLSNLEEWRIVIVADTKTPKDWSLKNTHFLSVEKQSEYAYLIYDLLPFKSYSRKNLGYLYAIQHGADLIYETDDDNILAQESIVYQPEKTEVYQFTNFTNKKVMNPYSYFGVPDMWPRGYPLEEIYRQDEFQVTKDKVKAFVPVQQGLADLDPDVDALFRLIYGKRIGKIKFEKKDPISYPKD